MSWRSRKGEWQKTVVRDCLATTEECQETKAHGLFTLSPNSAWFFSPLCLTVASLYTEESEAMGTTSQNSNQFSMSLKPMFF